MSQPIHQVVLFNATPTRVFDALTIASQFSAATHGAPTAISTELGGAFSKFGGHVVGRQLELVPGQRVVQAWRASTWEPGLFSIASFKLAAHEEGTQLTFDHVGFPEDLRLHLAAGWESNYWAPLRDFLA